MKIPQRIKCSSRLHDRGARNDWAKLILNHTWTGAGVFNIGSLMQNHSWTNCPNTGFHGKSSISMSHWTKNLTNIPTPCYLIDASQPKNNMAVIETIKASTNCHILLALGSTQPTIHFHPYTQLSMALRQALYMKHAWDLKNSKKTSTFIASQ